MAPPGPGNGAGMASPCSPAAPIRSSPAPRFPPCPAGAILPTPRPAISRARSRACSSAASTAPNGNPQPGPKFAYKLAWTERLIAHAAALHAAGIPAVLAGDYNIVPTPADIYNERSWLKNALLQPEPRAQFARLVAAGWTDALKHCPPEGPPWTFWSVFRDSVARDAGMRIDHLLLSPTLAPRLRATGVDRAVRHKAGASDHAPAWIDVA